VSDEDGKKVEKRVTPIYFLALLPSSGQLGQAWE
jgi:hypothetical protein